MRALCLVIFLFGLLGPNATLGGDSAGIAHADTSKAEREFKRGQKLFAKKDFRGALARYQAAYDAEPIPALLFNIAQCHRNLGEYRKAADGFRLYLEEADEKSDDIDRTLEQLSILRKAQRHVRARRYEKAIELFDRALEVEELAPVHRDRGRSLERVGKFDEAINSYRDYLEQLPEAEDAEEINEAIARLEKEIAGPGPIGEETPGKPVYKKWWFWGGVAGAVATAIVVGVVVSDDGIPGSDLGNIGFGQ